MQTKVDPFLQARKESKWTVRASGKAHATCAEDQSGSLLCPQFLQAAAEDILAAGKASLLLEAKQRCALCRLLLCTR